MTTSIGNNISSVDWSLKLGAVGEVVEGPDDVEQCVRIILTTPKGADPLRPTFGSNLWQYIDYPLDAAIPSIVREVNEAIMVWEPRITLSSVAAAPDNDVNGRLIITIIWRLRLGSASTPARTTIVTFPMVAVR